MGASLLAVAKSIYYERVGISLGRTNERTERGRCTFPVKNVYKKGERLDLGQSLPI